MTILKNILMATVCGVIFTGGAFAQKKAVKKEMAIQLYSAKDMIGNAENYVKNHERLFKAIADAGYTGVETANYKNGLIYGVTPKEFKADLDAAGLKAISAHINKHLSDTEKQTGDFSESLAWWEEAIKIHKIIGVKYLVCPSLRVKTLAELKQYCEYYNEVGRRCNAAGIKFGYHNHSHEFVKIEGEVMLDYMLQNTDPECVFFQMDVYWAVIGKASPVDYFKKYPGRWTMLHIKDKKEIGQSGMVGFDAIFRNCEEAGMKDYVIEIEGCRGDSVLEPMAASAEYLRTAPFVKKQY